MERVYERGDVAGSEDAMTPVLWRHTSLHLFGLTLLFTTSDLLLLAGIDTRWFGTVICYGRYSHTLQVWGGRKGRLADGD